MKGTKFSRKELIDIFESVLNKTLGEVDKNNVFRRTIDNPKITGIAGAVVEESVLGCRADSYQRPDLFVEGEDIELKTTGIRLSKKVKGVYEAKEPMSITAVSPEKIIYEEFQTSNFWHKAEKMLLVYYHYDSETTVKACDYANFYIKGYEFHEFDVEDRETLRNDWLIVRNFIEYLQDNYDVPEDEYPRISSELRKQLMMIDTAPKWPNRPRFRLKRSIVTNIVQNHFGESLEQLPIELSSYRELDYKLSEYTLTYKNMSIKNIAQKLNFDIKLNAKGDASKSIVEQIVVRMFGAQSKKISKIELFSKIGLIAKSITLSNKGYRTEDMKLYSIDFDEFCDEDIEFEESILFDYFSNHQLLCIVFMESDVNKLTENKFIGFKRLNFSDEFIYSQVYAVWEKVRDLINGNKLKQTILTDKFGRAIINPNGETKTQINFPKSKDGNVFLRGGGADSKDKPVVVNDIRMLRQFIWLKGSFVIDELEKEIYI